VPSLIQIDKNGRGYLQLILKYDPYHLFSNKFITLLISMES
jgi:hypothetical protein